MFERLKSALVNTALVVASLAMTYLVVQLVFFRYFLSDLPLDRRMLLSDRAAIFALDDQPADACDDTWSEPAPQAN